MTEARTSTPDQSEPATQAVITAVNSADLVLFYHSSYFIVYVDSDGPVSLQGLEFTVVIDDVVYTKSIQQIYPTFTGTNYIAAARACYGIYVTNNVSLPSVCRSGDTFVQMDEPFWVDGNSLLPVVIWRAGEPYQDEQGPIVCTLTGYGCIFNFQALIFASTPNP